MLRNSLALCLAFVCCGACGGDDPKPIDNEPIDGDKKMSELTTAEATSLCKKHQDDFDALGAVECTALGLSMGMSAEECATHRDACMETSGGGVDCDSVDTADLEGCDVPVAKTESCVDEVGAWARTITCDGERPDSFKPPDCLTELRQNCPLFGG